MSQNFTAAINCVLELIAVAHSVDEGHLYDDEMATDKWLWRWMTLPGNTLEIDRAAERYADCESLADPGRLAAISRNLNGARIDCSIQKRCTCSLEILPEFDI